GPDSPTGWRLAEARLERERAEEVRGLHQAIDDAWLHGRVPGVGDDVVLRFRPAPVEIPGGDRRAHDVVAPLDDDARDMPDPLDVVEQLIRMAQERAVDEVVALDPRERIREIGPCGVGDDLRVRAQPARRALPDTPGARRAGAH